MWIRKNVWQPGNFIFIGIFALFLRDEFIAGFIENVRFIYPQFFLYDWSECRVYSAGE